MQLILLIHSEYTIASVASPCFMAAYKLVNKVTVVEECHAPLEGHTGLLKALSIGVAADAD